MAYKTTDMIACPHCGNDDHSSISNNGSEIYDSFFDGAIGSECFCDKCDRDFTVWFTVSEIDWDDEED